MRCFRCFVVALLLIGVGSAASAGGPPKLMKEVEAIGDALTAAMLEEDFESMLAMYTNDAISLPNYGPKMVGKEAFRKHHMQMAAAGIKVRSFESEPTDVWRAGDHVIEIGSFSITLDMPGMPGMQDQGKYMTVYVRQKGGSLKIKAETWNTDMNPMLEAAQ